MEGHMLLAELIIKQEERGKVLQGLSMCKTLLCVVQWCVVLAFT